MTLDALVARVVRDALLICGVLAAAAWFLFGGRVAGGVLGGGALLAISFYTLEGGVAALVASAVGRAPARGVATKTVLKLVLRYALLGFLAYVMIARLRLHPIGLLVGASSIVAAVGIEAVRLHTKKSS